MKKLNRILRKESATWTLATLTILTAAFSLWTSNNLYKSRGEQIVTEDVDALAGRCTFSFSISDLPPCQNIDIVGVSIDRSSSMNVRETDGVLKVEHARRAAKTFFKTLADAKAAGVAASNVKASLNSFGAQSNTGGRLASTYNSKLHTALTTNIMSAYNAVDGVVYVKPGTCIECGLRLCNNQAQNSTNPKKVCILLSDGLANHNLDGSTSNAKARALAEAQRGRDTLGVVYHVIGYGTNRDETVLKGIAGLSDPTASKRGSYVYKPNAQDWSNTMVQILTRVCTQ